MEKYHLLISKDSQLLCLFKANWVLKKVLAAIEEGSPRVSAIGNSLDGFKFTKALTLSEIESLIAETFQGSDEGMSLLGLFLVNKEKKIDEKKIIRFSRTIKV